MLLVGLLTGCATNQAANPNLLKFIEDGKTKRVEVLLQLGQPSAAYEHQMVLTYRLSEDPHRGYYLIVPNTAQAWQNVQYSLVLVFDDQGVLQRHNLVPVQ